MRHAPLAALAVAALLAVGGCGKTHPAPTGEVREGLSASRCDPGDPACSCVEVDTRNYDTTCAADSDCVAISAGTLCGAGSCFAANAAINADSSAAYEKDREPVEYAGCVSATSGAVACVDQVCVLRLPTSSGSSSGSAPGSGSHGSAADGSPGTGSDGTGIVVDLGDDDDDDTVSTSTGDDSSSSKSSSSGDDDDDDDDDKHESEARDAGRRARSTGSTGSKSLR